MARVDYARYAGQVCTCGVGARCAGRAHRSNDVAQFRYEASNRITVITRRRYIVNNVDGQCCIGTVAVQLGDHDREVVGSGIPRRALRKGVLVVHHTITRGRVIAVAGDFQCAVAAGNLLSHYACYGLAVEREGTQAVYGFEGNNAVGNFTVGWRIAACRQAGFIDVPARDIQLYQ